MVVRWQPNLNGTNQGGGLLLGGLAQAGSSALGMLCKDEQ